MTSAASAMSAGTGSTSEARPSCHVTPAMSASEATFAPSKRPASTGESRKRGMMGPVRATKTKPGRKDPDGSKDGPRDPGEDVSDKSRRGEDRPRRNLSYGHGVEQLLARQEPGIDELGP